MPLLALLTTAAPAVPAPYEVQETQRRGPSTLILAAYVSPDAVGHSLLILRDASGKTRWKHYLGWKYHLHKDQKALSVRTLLPDGQTLLKFFDEKTGENYATNRFVDLTGWSVPLTPAPAPKKGRP